MSPKPWVVLDDIRARRSFVYGNPVELIVARSSEEVGPALRAMNAAIAAGKHLAGYLSYELGYALESKLAARLPVETALPLLWFGVFDAPPRVLEDAQAADFAQGGRAYAGQPQFEWSGSDYRQRFAEVVERIERGDVFQANLSFRARFPVVGPPFALYLEMRKAADVAYAAYVDDGENAILSFSPELFFEVVADGTLRTQPMKGTAARGRDEVEDDTLREALRTSAKNRAENLMIVDLMRNDLGRVAETGSVAAERLFDVDTYATVHQMTSTVSAKLRRDCGPQQIVRALFPPGSVSGAPKIRAMEILHELETTQRGVYCGAIGRFDPDGTAAFNVAIRTITIRDGCGELGCGGAVVADSDAAGEYAECLLKTRYFTAGRKALRLIETLRCERGDPIRLDLHLSRMEISARRFGFLFDRRRVHDAALRGASRDVARERMRIVLDEAGTFEVTTQPLDDTQQGPWRFAISPLRLDSTDELLRHKTDWREFHDGEQSRLHDLYGCDEVLFLNERGELCEGSRSNLFLRIDGVLLTPAQSCGLLDGCLRREMLEQGLCHEAVLTRADLDRATEIYLGNSLRGLIHATQLPMNG
jgi:para-aminobenzoate synthetase/4-amino-4-deoxychorismate lyase